MAERTFFKLPYLPPLKPTENNKKISKEENIISDEMREKPQPQTTKYKDYLPNTEKHWCKKRC